MCVISQIQILSWYSFNTKFFEHAVGLECLLFDRFALGWAEFQWLVRFENVDWSPGFLCLNGRVVGLVLHEKQFRKIIFKNGRFQAYFHGFLVIFVF